MLANEVIAANKNTVLVTVNGGLISLDELKETAPAIINAGMPGVQGGSAIASTVFGENVLVRYIGNLHASYLPLSACLLPLCFYLLAPVVRV